MAFIKQIQVGSTTYSLHGYATGTLSTTWTTSGNFKYQDVTLSGDTIPADAGSYTVVDLLIPTASASAVDTHLEMWSKVFRAEVTTAGKVRV